MRDVAVIDDVSRLRVTVTETIVVRLRVSDVDIEVLRVRCCVALNDPKVLVGVAVCFVFVFCRERVSVVDAVRWLSDVEEERDDVGIDGVSL